MLGSIDIKMHLISEGKMTRRFVSGADLRNARNGSLGRLDLRLAHRFFVSLLEEKFKRIIKISATPMLKINLIT